MSEDKETDIKIEEPADRNEELALIDKRIEELNLALKLDQYQTAMPRQSHSVSGYVVLFVILGFLAFGIVTIWIQLESLWMGALGMDNALSVNSSAPAVGFIAGIVVVVIGVIAGSLIVEHKNRKLDEEYNEKRMSYHKVKDEIRELEEKREQLLKELRKQEKNK